MPGKTRTSKKTDQHALHVERMRLLDRFGASVLFDDDGSLGSFDPRHEELMKLSPEHLAAECVRDLVNDPIFRTVLEQNGIDVQSTPYQLDLF
jgi:hypothetical protein